MPNTTDITGLPLALAVDGTEDFPLVQGGTTKRAKTGLIMAGSSGASVQDANTVFAGPVSGPAAAPSFRALVPADIPNGLPAGGDTGQQLVKLSDDDYDVGWVDDPAVPEPANTVLAGPVSGPDADPTFRSLVNGDLPTVDVSHGGSGRTSATAYAVLCGGTTATGAHQSVASVGTTGQALLSNGAGNLPTFQTLATAVGQALTNVDDTNVTLTLGGTPATSLLQATSITAGWSGQLAVTRGGTGIGSVAQGDLLYGSAANTLSALAKSTSATRYLANTGTSNNPAWAQIDLTNGVTGVLPAANGGTGQSSYTVGDMLYASGTTALSKLAASTSGYHLQAAGAGVAPAWAGFLQTGVGAVTRTWLAKDQDIKSVKDYGATGDGTTDDTTAIQAAFTAAQTAGRGAIYFPAGQYKITSAITYDANYLTVYGDGPGASEILCGTNSQNGFAFGNGSSSRESIVVRDLGFNITGLVAKTGGAAVLFSKCQNVATYNLRIANNWHGVRLTACVIANVESLWITDPTATNGVGILIDTSGGNASNDHYVRDVVVTGTLGSECRAAVEINNSTGTWLDTVGGLQCTNGLVILAATGVTIEHIFSSNCAWDTCTNNGALIQANGTGIVRRIVSVGDWYCTNTLSGAATAGAGTVSLASFIGCRFYNNVQHGAAVATGTNLRFQGCQISGNSRSSSGTYDGINIAAGVTLFAVSDCISSQTSGFSNTQRYGLAIETGASDNYIVTDNNFLTNATGGLLDGGSGTSKVIRGNLPTTTLDRSFNKVVIGTTDQISIAPQFQAFGTIACTHTGTASYVLHASGGGSDEKYSDFNYGSAAFNMRFLNDAFNSATTWLSATRSGMTTTAIGLTATTVTLTGNATVTGTLRINQAPAAIGTGAKTITNAADSSTNFGHYLSLNMNGTTYYIPCSSVAPT